jgi:hypothetical protein
MNYWLLVLSTGVVTCMNLVAEEWNDWRDDRRVLLVRAALPEDDRLKEQKNVLSAQTEGLAVRDVMVVEWTGEADPEVWRPSGRVLVIALAREIQAELRSAAWKVLLIGRDGGIKAAWDKVVPPDEIFAKIDAMPMGRSEKRARESGSDR